MKGSQQNVAELLVKCLEEEGVEYIFGLPGEENTDFIEALSKSQKIRFILTRHEQGASFIADIYGRLTGKAGVCLATLGPGAINLLLGTADANLDSSPLVALVAQAAINRLHKESHQIIDLTRLFSAVTKWDAMLSLPSSVPELVRKGFKQAQSERCGAVALVLPEDVAQLPAAEIPLRPQSPKMTMPNHEQIKKAAECINAAKQVMILAGAGVYRHHAEEALARFINVTKIPIATTFMAKGVVPADNPLVIGAIGFMRQDYTNFGFARADLIITVGYDLVEYAPSAWNPHRDKKIIHIHGTPAEVDANYVLTVGIEGGLGACLDALANEIKPRDTLSPELAKLRTMLLDEVNDHENDDSFPLKPQRIIADLRKAMRKSDIILCDTGALKMWMARLYPCYQSNTCIISNSLATMGFSLPGALAAKLVYPDRHVMAVMGDGSFLMNSQEIETAKREKIPFIIFIWRDNAYGLIQWKQELEYGDSHHVKFSNPDFVKYAESFGIRAHSIQSAQELLPVLQSALASNEIVLIDCPVDYSENTKLTDKLGKLTQAI
ncbi:MULTISPECIES: acetolactate synthase large subunit [Legionella]|uniref:Acetolactate synthase large subunit n=1 Tax=Legionella septentrionalis TaxID=2498109 RepID=A0A3S0X251_9GAMM|nr:MULTISPECIES: acetolactate synthase large subunit [Legionella]MCP0913133.1 acetolactate synthase large subunit [Legionella sp. 27cVA30]RUQ91582.1 acetolactate synthase large subunit [Legionella septentrionalis]RUR02481.1 acetolactate synthase large subunit [Legionella septentrionalis]RUR10632.1 acetolactate synthase large subunit [Legionella septentrionalis]RUR17139.1 acetolactate synthase large subunit [Legionella septentrionalis]